MIVISDTSPLNYLALIGQAERLHDLYGRVVIPRAVLDELHAAETPEEVRAWLLNKPDWLEVQALVTTPDAELAYLGAGEREAIALAQQLRADAILMDDRDGRREASRRRLRVIGTLAVLVDAAERGLLELPEAFRRLQQTTFRASPRLFESLLAQRRSSTRQDTSETNPSDE
jgi:predicted nucleic acid-binding protein